MNKPLFKKVRVIHNPHKQEFIVDYKVWFRWNYDRSFFYYEQGERPSGRNIFSKDEAKKLATDRAEELLGVNIVFEKSNILYHI